MAVLFAARHTGQGAAVQSLAIAHFAEDTARPRWLCALKIWSNYSSVTETAPPMLRPVRLSQICAVLAMHAPSDQWQGGSSETSTR